MERRVLLAVFLSFLVLVAYQSLVGPPPAPESPVVDAEAPVSPTTPTAARSPTAAPGVASPAAAVEVAVGETTVRDIAVEGTSVRAVFTNRGAKLVSWELLDYTDDAGSPVELVPADVAPDQAWPFTLSIPGDAETTAHLDGALFQASTSGLRLMGDEASLIFEYADSSGLRAEKVFTFLSTAGQPYVVDFTATVTRNGNALPVSVQWGPALGGVRAETSYFVFQQLPAGVLYGRELEGEQYQETDILRPQPGDLAERSRYEGQFSFVGVDNHYFLAAALPGERPSHVDFRAISTAADEHDLVAFDLSVDVGTDPLPVFLGPKDFDVLGAVDPDLVRAIDFGFLSVLVVPLHRTLKWIYGFLGNYGWSIIALTALINIVIFPLRHKSVTSMRKMQEVQPEMKAIQERYAGLKATDPAKQKMNKEVMELYGKHGVNPVSGCLPMLLTMPILIAFYRLLSMAVELRGAPFMGWITDLSVQDPLYVTPVLMGASMVLQQRLTPSVADPMQQKVMMLMPVMFTVMFLWAPSGLVIYWFTSNLFGISQQVITNRLAGPPRTRQVRPAAERQTRKAAPPEVVDVDPVPDSGTDSRSSRGSRKRSGRGSRRGRR